MIGGIVTPAPAWFKDVPCRGLTELFFPPVEDPHKSWTAIGAVNVCRENCEHMIACAELSFSEKTGIWGGLSVEQRRNYWRIRKQGMSPEDAWALASESSRSRELGK